MTRQQRRAKKHRTASPWYPNTEPTRRASIGCGSAMAAPFLALLAALIGATL